MLRRTSVVITTIGAWGWWDTSPVRSPTRWEPTPAPTHPGRGHPWPGVGIRRDGTRGPARSAPGIPPPSLPRRPGRGPGHARGSSPDELPDDDRQLVEEIERNGQGHHREGVRARSHHPGHHDDRHEGPSPERGELLGCEHTGQLE